MHTDGTFTGVILVCVSVLAFPHTAAENGRSNFICPLSNPLGRIERDQILAGPGQTRCEPDRTS